jgi:hypothetical protein
MSAKRAEDYYDDDDDDDEGDFVPGADEDEDSVADDDDDDDLENLEPPPYLQGKLANDERLAGCFTFQSEPEGKFRLSSTGSIPKDWSLQNPVTTKPVEFGGWIQHPAKWYNFSLDITKANSQSVLEDPLSKKMLDAQENNQPINGELLMDGKMPAKDGKMPAAGLKSPPKEYSSSSSPSLKKPPPYSLKEPPSAESAQLKKAPPSSSSSEDDLIYSITGKQVEAEGDSIMEFHGFIRPPTAEKTHIFLIGSVQVTHAATAAASAKAPPAAVAAKAAAKRSSRDDEDDDSVTNDGGVAYNELIALHDDARLSTEELRLKYYGGALDGAKAQRKRAKSAVAEDDDDDDIGF